MSNMDYRKEKQSDDFEYQSDSVHSVSKSQSRRQRYLQMKKLKSSRSRSRSRSPCAPLEILIPDDSDVTDDERESNVPTARSTNGNDGDTESDEEDRPLLVNNGSSRMRRHSNDS